MTKRKVDYSRGRPQARRGPPAGPDGAPVERPNLATINMQAGAGRAGLSVGDRVRIGGTGLYAGEIAVIERLSAGAIPSALVRTAANNTRQVRTIDLEPVPAERPPAPAERQAAPVERPPAD